MKSCAVQQVYSVMTKLSKFIPDARLRNLTPLLRFRATGRDGAPLSKMLSGYKELREFIPQLEIDYISILFERSPEN